MNLTKHGNMALLTDQDKSFIQKLKAQGYTKEDAFSALTQVKQANGDKTFTFGERFMQNLKKAPEAIFGKESVTQKIGQAVPDFGVLENVSSALEGSGQSFVQSVGDLAQATQEKSLPEAVTKTSSGVSNMIGAGLGTAFAPGAAVMGLPVVGEPIKKIAEATTEGVDLVAAGLGDLMATDDEGAQAIRQNINNLAALLGVKYGPQASESMLKGLSEGLNKGKTSVTTSFPNATKLVNDTIGTAQSIGGKAVSSIGKKVGDIVQKDRTAIGKNLEGLTQIENANASLRKFVEAARQKGVDVKQIIAESDLLKDSVDPEGKVRTVGPDGAVEKLRAFLKPQENVVRTALEQEGKMVPLSDVKQKMIDDINSSGLMGKNKLNALDAVDKEISGLSLDAVNGEIPVYRLHDAKIDKYSTINYLDPSSKVIDKSLAKTMRQIIEDNSSTQIAKLNNELKTWYTVADFLERLDGRTVKGGRLGKYFSQGIGAIAGSPFGPLGSLVGSEIGASVQSGMMQRTLSGGGKPLKKSAFMDNTLKDQKLTGREISTRAKLKSEAEISAKKSPASSFADELAKLSEKYPALIDMDFIELMEWTKKNRSILPKTFAKAVDALENALEIGPDGLRYNGKSLSGLDDILESASELDFELDVTPNAQSKTVQRTLKEQAAPTDTDLINRLSPKLREAFEKGSIEEKAKALDYLRLKYGIENNTSQNGEVSGDMPF